LQFEEVQRAFDMLKEVSADEKARETYELRRKTEEGFVSEIALKTAAAKREGREERKIEGEKIGASEKAIEVAQKMLSNGLDISDFIGLSISEIQNLKFKERFVFFIFIKTALKDKHR